MGKFSRDKGKRFEQKVARLFRKAFPHRADKIKRGQQTRYGTDAPDIEWADPYWPECKHDERISPWAAIRQAVNDAPEGRVPVAICKKNRKAPIAVMLLEDWFDLIKEHDERGRL